MRTQKALINFSKTKDNDLSNTAQNIVNKMSLNPYFTDPQPPLATLQDAINAYTTALVKAKDGSKEDTANKNACRLTLESTLFSLGNYVNLIAETDLVKLDSSGFPVSKVPEPIGILPAPSLTVGYGKNPGELTIDIDVVPKASGYIVLYSQSPAPAENTEWYQILLSTSKGMLIHLTSGTKYVIKAAAISSEANKLGQYNFSEPVEKIAP
jgi:hypothetical protein